jgi:phage N-6-adenine-methyltransferase
VNTEVMFSSKTDMWATPQDFFDLINKEFPFTVDVCATEDNAKCTLFYSPEKDGLKQIWKGVCWMNPPYGDPEFPCKKKCKKKKCLERGFHNEKYIPGIRDWVQKAYESAKNGTIVVGLLPARTDTKWFHDYIYNKAEIRFIRGRLKFGGCANSAPFPNMLVIWGQQVMKKQRN